MGIFSRRLLDCVQWKGTNGVLAHREKENNIRKFSTLIVTEAQEAVMVINGEKTAKFSAGMHSIDTANIPILSDFYGLPYSNGQNPWYAQIWFVNKSVPVNFQWHTDSFNIHDYNYQTNIPLRAEGRFGVVVKDAEKFILKLCLGYPEGENGVDVTSYALGDQMFGMLTTNAKGLISRVMANKQMGINDISQHLSEISNVLYPEVEKFYLDYGCQLTQFSVTSIDIDETTEAGRIIRKAITSQSAQRISGHSWQQEQMFEMANKAIDQFSGGSNSGLVGAVMASSLLGGAGMGMGFGGGAMMQPVFNQPGPQAPNPNGGIGGGMSAQPAIRRVYCSNCSKSYESTSSYCPHCGNPYRPCPKCGSDNAEHNTRCTQCGTPLVRAAAVACPRCGKYLAKGIAFCDNCGQAIAQDTTPAVCPQCGSSVKGARFCPCCGKKLR